MTITARDRRALLVLGIAAAIFVVLALWPEDSGAPEVVGSAGPAASIERLSHVRKLAAQRPAREQELARLRDELTRWEAGILQAETGQQAQAGLLQALRETGRRQSPAVDFAQVEIGPIRALGKSEDYGEALVSVSFQCGVEQLVNFLADLTARPEAIATEELRINPGDAKKKSLNVRLTVAGLVPHGLVPQQKGLGSF
jgi:hypothetical protein